MFCSGCFILSDTLFDTLNSLSEKLAESKRKVKYLG